MPSHEFAVGAGFHYAPFFEHYYLVGIFHCAQPVGYDNHRATPVKTGKVIDYGTFVIGIERVCSLVKENVVGIFIYGSGYEYALFLPKAHAHSVVAYDGVVLERQGFDECVDARHPCRLGEPHGVDFAVFGGDIAGNAFAE